MADDRIRLPSGQGGLVRYSDESVSKIVLSPGVVVILSILIMVIVVILHSVGSRLLG